MSNQRLVFLETNYSEGIIFDQKDTVLAYQILSRATRVNSGTMIIPSGKDIEIKLISPDKLIKEEDFLRPPAAAPDSLPPMIDPPF